MHIIVAEYVDSTKCEIQVPACGGAHVGTYVRGQRYLPYEVVTKDLSMWIALRETIDTPGASSSDWAPFEAPTADQLGPIQERWLADLNQLIRTLVGATL